MFSPGQKLRASDLNAINRGSARRTKVHCAASLQCAQHSGGIAVTGSANGGGVLTPALITGKSPLGDGYTLAPLSFGPDGSLISAVYTIDPELAQETEIVAYGTDGAIHVPPFLTLAYAQNPEAFAAGQEVYPTTPPYPLAYEASGNKNVPIGAVVPVELSQNPDQYGNDLYEFNYPDLSDVDQIYTPAIYTTLGSKSRLIFTNLQNSDIFDGLTIDMDFSNNAMPPNPVPASWIDPTLPPPSIRYPVNFPYFTETWRGSAQLANGQILQAWIVSPPFIDTYKPVARLVLLLDSGEFTIMESNKLLVPSRPCFGEYRNYISFNGYDPYEISQWSYPSPPDRKGSVGDVPMPWYLIRRGPNFRFATAIDAKANPIGLLEPAFVFENTPSFFAVFAGGFNYGAPLMQQKDGTTAQYAGTFTVTLVGRP